MVKEVAEEVKDVGREEAKGVAEVKTVLVTGKVSLEELKEMGYSWAVVQSLHLLCGHEFYRLVEEVKQSSVRTSIGLPLLSGPEDYEAVVQGLIFRKTLCLHFHHPV